MTEIKENWKEIPGYPNYKVSNLGAVRSFNRNKLLSQEKTRHGYNRVSLCNNGIVRRFSVHRLVACVFNDVSLDTKLHICHKNDVRDDNRLCNLFLGTQKDNMEDAAKKGRVAKGIDNGNRKLTEEQVLKIRHLHKSGNYSLRELGRMFKTHNKNIHLIVKMQVWKHI